MRRYYFTLMEVLIAMTLLALTASVVGFGFHKMIKEEKFRTSVELVTQEIQTAEEMMLILGENVKVKIQKDQRDGSYFLKKEIGKKKLNPKDKERFKKLEGVQYVAFTDEQRGTKQDLIEIVFYPAGRKMTKGILTLGQGSLTKSIILSGTPRPITQKITPTSSQEYASEDFFPKNLRDEYLQNPTRPKAR